jgi:phage shock protein A
MEAEADLVNYGKQPTLEDEFAQLETDEEIEKELQALKEENPKKSGKKEPSNQ